MRLFRRGTTRGELEDWQPRLYAVLIGLLLIVAYVIAFIVKNNDRIKIDFVLFDTHTSLIWLIILLLAIGFIGGVMLSQLYRRRRRLRADETVGGRIDRSVQTDAHAEHARPEGGAVSGASGRAPDEQAGADS